MPGISVDGQGLREQLGKKVKVAGLVAVGALQRHMTEEERALKNPCSRRVGKS